MFGAIGYVANAIADDIAPTTAPGATCEQSHGQHEHAGRLGRGPPAREHGAFVIADAVLVKFVARSALD